MNKKGQTDQPDLFGNSIPKVKPVIPDKPRRKPKHGDTSPTYTPTKLPYRFVEKTINPETGEQRTWIYIMGYNRDGKFEEIRMTPEEWIEIGGKG